MLYWVVLLGFSLAVISTVFFPSESLWVLKDPSLQEDLTLAIAVESTPVIEIHEARVGWVARL